jgi:hypothetical protein
MRNQTKDDRYMIVTLPNGRQMEVPKNATQVLVAKEAIAAGYISEEEMYKNNKPLADAMGYKIKNIPPPIQNIGDPTSASEPFSAPFGSAPSSGGGRTPLSGFDQEDPWKPSSTELGRSAGVPQGRPSLFPEPTQFQRGPSAVVGTPPPAKQPQVEAEPQGSVFIGRYGRRVEIPKDGSTRFAMGGGRMVPVTQQEDPWTTSIGEFREKSPELLAKEGSSVREYLRGLEIYKDLNSEYEKRIANRDIYKGISPARLAQYDAETQRIATESNKWKKYTEKYEPIVQSTINKDVDELTASEKAREFYTIDKNGAVNVDAVKVTKYVDNALSAYGIKDTSKLDMRDKWTKSAIASIESVERQNAGMRKVEETMKSIDISKLPKPIDIDAERKKIEGIAAKYSEQAKQEIDAYDNQVLSPSRQKIESEYENTFNAIQKEADRIASMYSSGGINRAQYDSAYAQLEGRASQAEAEYKQKYSELEKSVEQNIAAINFRWNQSYQREAQAEQDAYNASINEFNKQLSALYETPEVRLKIKQAYKEGYQQQAEKELKAQEKSNKERYEKGIDPLNLGEGFYQGEGMMYGGKNPFAIMPFNRELARLSERYVKGLSGAVKSYGIALGSEGLYNLGLEGENKWNLPQLENKGLKDLGSLAWFERQAELGGYMTPGIGATAITAAATAPLGGSGVALTGRFLLTGFSGWASETAQITADIRSRVLDETGSIEKADRAAQRAFDAQVAISGSYLLEGAPFIKLPFLKAGRVMSTLTGFGAEYGQELFLQEGPQQIAEKRIMAEAKGNIKLGEGLMAAYDNFYQGVADMMAPVETIAGTKPSEFEQLAVDLIGIGGLGAVGGYRDVGQRNRQMANDIKSFLANDVIATRIKNGDFQWINSIVESRGETFASSLVGQFHVAGQISNEQKAKLNRNIEAAAILQDDVQRLGLKGDESIAYKALAGRASEAQEIAEKETNEIIKKVHQAEFAEAQRQMEAIAMGKGFTGTIVTTPNGKKVFMSEKEFKDAVNDMEFLGTIAMLGLQREGGIQITSHGPGSDVALTDFWENVVELQNGMSRDIGLVNKKYGTVVDYVVNTSDPSQSGIKVMAEGRPDDKAGAEALLYRLGYNVIGYEPPAKSEPITEVELVNTLGAPDSEVEAATAATSPTTESLATGGLLETLKAAKNAEYINENQLADAENELYNLAGEIEAREDLSQEQKDQMVYAIEQSIQTIQDYGFRTRTETRTTTQTVATRTPKQASKAPLRGATPIATAANEGIAITYDDGVSGPKEGVVKKENGQYVFYQKPMGAIKKFKPIVIGDAAIVDGSVQFGGIQEMQNRGLNAVASISLPNGRSISILDDDLSIDAGIHVARLELGDVPQNEFDIEFNTITTENQIEVPYVYTPKTTQQTPTTDAVQKPTTAEVGAQPSRTEGVREEGGGGVRPGVQGTQATQEGGAQAEVTPAATTEAIAAPKEETLKKMEKLSEAEGMSNKKARGETLKKMLKQDARLAEVDANFDKAVKELEDAGKLQVSCRTKT